MEIRCGGCNKLFRVSDDKITGKGIKFACTRCGESIKITREDFDNYSLSQTAVTALDMYASKAKRPAVSAGTDVKAEAGPVLSAAIVEPGPREKAPAASTVSESQASAVPDFLQETGTPPTPEPPAFVEQPLQAETEHVREPEPMLAKEALFEPQPAENEAAKQESRAEIKEESKAGPEQKPASAPEPGPVSIKEQMAGPMPEPKIEPKPAAKSEPKPQPAQEQKTGPAISSRTVPKPAGPPRPEPVRKSAAGVAASVGTSVPARKAPARPASPAPPVTVIGASPARPARSGIMILLVLIIVIALAGTGAFFFIKSSKKPVSEPAPIVTSTGALRILNASGSMEANGDLVISGEIENMTDREQRAWYVVVDVYDATGAVINKLRLVNGKQLFTRNDYAIMEGRGMNVRDLKAQALSQQGVVILPKGKVPFEIRYLQPPKGVASFNTTLQPFDPIRLYKEMAEEAQ